ncbi:DUF7266 family protein [Halocalculus aciditolerans]|uniref:Uncharacterized protein n=1 Tax=Halocalculus aciditolerans TaxID=1383812 RepID=A0A830F4Q5_9EURY|nr:hypothetical protein [Halocalculus aciditolerans]GGL63433.1 hypothetical protein GCM10009039_21680 [Halocalculus aciditolerans]
MTDTRAATPAVSKALEASLVVLFVGFLVTALYGGFVPTHRAAAADAVADRAASTAAAAIEDAVPVAASRVSVTRRVSLPERIHGDPYTLSVTDRRLVLDATGARVTIPLVLPERVASIRGTWHSTRRLRVRVTGSDAGISVRLAEVAA